MFRTALIATALLVVPQLHAQDGGQLFTLYCSACHGTDGKGATGGQFPPLAGSPWVLGDPSLSAKIVLHGLHGPVEVGGRTFNLEMPPQGGMLPDDQIAAILTYVRSSWGNKASAITGDFVKATRAANADRKAAWTAEELLKLHPLPVSAPPIANLLSQVYEGQWQDLPDFSTLKAGNIEEEHDGRISLKKAGFTDHFGMVWQGDLTAPESGKFTFRLDADDGARVVIDGKEIVKVGGNGPMDGSRMKDGEITLSAGVHKLRVDYYENYGREGITLAWRGPGIPAWRNLSDTPLEQGREPIQVEPKAGRAVIYRNFIAGTTPRAIGVGFPGGVNLAYSADHFAPELIWTGAFMDGSRHWVDRGQGNQPPAGKQVVKLSDSAALPEEARFRGYKLDPAGNPTFSVQLGKQYLLDTWQPAGSANSPAFIRTLSVKGQGGPVELLLAEKLPLQNSGERELSLGNDLVLQVESHTPETRDGKVFLKLVPGQTATLTYRWK
jgi:mono/diheme cytochrome c family protein